MHSKAVSLLEEPPSIARGAHGGASQAERVRSPAPRKGRGGLRAPRRQAVKRLEVGVAFDLKSEIERLIRTSHTELPEDGLEEYDSEATVEAIEGALFAAGHEPRRLGSGRQLLHAIMRRPSGLVFNIAEGWGTRSREAHVPAALEMLGVPYTHSDPLTLALTLDKALAKRVVASCAVPTPAYAVVESVDDADALELCYPLIAKPLFEGSSMGIRRGSRVTSLSELRALLQTLLRDYREPVLVEEFCGGAELTVGVLGTGRGARVFGSMQIEPRGGDAAEFVYSLEMKRNYLAEVDYFAPPKLDPAMRADAEACALAAYRALGCRDVGRVDIRFGADGVARFLEVNPLPGLSPVSSDLSIMCRGYGISYEELIGSIVDEARSRLSV